VVDRKTIHVHDLLAEEAEFPMASGLRAADGASYAFRRALTARTKEVIVRSTSAVRKCVPFTDRQIELVQTFAARR